MQEPCLNVQLREGLFSEADLNQLEHGYSVSDTDEEKGGLLSGINEDLLSLKSGLSLVAGNPQNELLNKARQQEHHNQHYQEIATQKIKYFKKIAQLEKLIEQTKSEKQQLQVVVETQKQNFQFQLQQQEMKHTQQIREIKDLAQNGEAFQDKLEAYKAEFSKAELVICEETYIDLKARTQQSLKQFIQIKVFEQLQQYQSDLQQKQKQTTELLKSQTSQANKIEQQSIELNGLRQQLKDVKDDAERRIAALNRRNLDVESDLGQLDAQYKQINEKSGKLQQQDEVIRKLDVEVQSLRVNKQDLESQLATLRESKSEVERRNESLRREIDILTQDKAFLQREASSYEEKNKRLDDRLNRAELQLLDAKKQAEKYMDRVLSANDEVKTKFDTQYHKEIEDLKDRQQRELQLNKQNLTDLYEKKVEYLTERGSEQEKRIHKLEHDLREKQKSYEEVMFEFRNFQKNYDLECGSLKLEARSKQDQVTRMQHLYEDNLCLVKETKLENEMLRQKLDVVKQEYYKLESTARSGSGEIRAELAVCKERLANYEMIEKELDQAIMHVAGDEGQGEGFEVGNALIQTITQAPTTAKRRIQQSLLLANRLQQKQKDNEALLQEIKQMRDKLENAEAETKLHKRLLERTNQPQSYLLQDVERSEKELDHAQRKIKANEEAMKKLRLENDQLKNQKKALAEDLQKLLARRQDIENLQTTLVGLIQNSSSRKIDIDELKSKLATSVRQTRYQSDVKPEKDLRRSSSKGKEMDKTVKRYDGSDDTAVPAWYKVLKKNL